MRPPVSIPHIVGSLFALAGLVAAAAAGAEEAASERPWSASAEVGLVSTSGNTETTSVNAKARVGYEYKRWVHNAQLDFLHASDDGETTAERTELRAKSRYYYADQDYLFARLRYEDDRFSGFDYQASEVLGYGHRFLSAEDLTVDLAAGAGLRQRKAEGGDSENDPLLLLEGGLAWEVSETGTFTQDLTVEATEDNTWTESVTALSVRINGNLAMKASLTARHNSDVPEDVENTDTITAVNLVFDY